MVPGLFILVFGRYHRDRVLEWEPTAIDKEIMRQVEWEKLKRSVVLDCVRVNTLRNRMSTAAAARQQEE